MKLKHFKHFEGYHFLLIFTNGEVKTVDLAPLISRYVTPEALQTAQINVEWGCLEFNQGQVDIEPKTLYHFAQTQLSLSTKTSAQSELQQVQGV